MLYNTKLNEFEINDIQPLLNLVEQEIKTLFDCAKDVAKWDSSDLKVELLNKYENQINTFLLWKVQLENAKKDVEEMNKVNAG